MCIFHGTRKWLALSDKGPIKAGTRRQLCVLPIKQHRVGDDALAMKVKIKSWNAVAYWRKCAYSTAHLRDHRHSHTPVLALHEQCGM